MGDQTNPSGRFDRPALDVEVLGAASRRHWVLTTRELHALGMSDRQIRHRVARGFLHRRHHGIYAVGRAELSFEGACLAAVLACGPGAAISHGSAVRLRGLRDDSGPIHISIPRERAGHPGLRVHRPRALPSAEVAVHRGIAVTTVARTLLDVAASESPRRLGWLMHEAAVQRVLDLRELWSVVERHPHHRGARKLGAALADEVAPTRTGLERAYLKICRREGLPMPKVNEKVWSTDRREEVDFHWPEARLVVETDGGRYHSTRWRRLRDAEKSARLEAAGWRVRRFGELEVELDPGGVGAETARLYALGRSNEPPGSV